MPLILNKGLPIPALQPLRIPSPRRVGSGRSQRRKHFELHLPRAKTPWSPENQSHCFGGFSGSHKGVYLVFY